jgi:hypothetical protein
MRVRAGPFRRTIMPRWAITLLIFLIALVGWAGLAYLVFNYVPDPWTVGLAVCLVFVAVAGTVMPPVHFLNYRFARQVANGDGIPSDNGWTVYRQSGMVGLLAALCCWFQVMRVLNWIIVMLLVGVIVLVEVFFRSRAD